MNGLSSKLRAAAKALRSNGGATMITNDKGRAGYNHATTPKTTKHTRHFTDLVAHICIKAAIIAVALRSLLLVAVADWLINLGGQRDV